MIWFKKAADRVPVVPDDEPERLAAIERSRCLLEEARQRGPMVDQVAAALNAHDERNHYRDRLYMLITGEAPS